MPKLLVQRLVGMSQTASSLALDARTVWRLARTAWHLMHGLVVVTLLFPRLTLDQRQQRIGRWSHQVLRALGVTLRPSGQLMAGPQMLVANHVSWLDVMALHALCPQARFVAKAEVRHWPLIGRLVVGAQTVFVDRARPRQTGEVVNSIAAVLVNGATVAVFPEGTTGNGHAVLPFRSGLLQAALTAGVAIRPVALRYADAHHRISPHAPYIDDDTLLGSLWRTARAERLVVHANALQLPTQDLTDRRALANSLRAAIQTALI